MRDWIPSYSRLWILNTDYRLNLKFILDIQRSLIYINSSRYQGEQVLAQFWLGSNHQSSRFTVFFFFRCVRISTRGLVRRLVGWSVGPSVMLSSKSIKNGLLRTLNDLDSAGRGKKRDEEEGGTRRKEGRGGRRDGEEGGTRRVKEWKSCQKMKNEKVAERRIIGLAGPCYKPFLLSSW